jgi:iron(III) transport system permease protein
MMRRPRWLDGLNLLILSVVLVAPLGALLWAAFSEGSNGNPKAAPALVGAQHALLLGRSVCLAVCAGGVGTLIGLLAGYAVAAQPRKAQARLAVLMMLPLVIPPFVHALSWIMLANGLGWAIHGFWTAALVLAASFWPIAALLTWAGLRQSGGAQIEAACLAHGRLRAFWRIELGLIRPHLSTGFLLLALFSFSDYGVPSLLRVNTYPVFVFSQFAAFYDLRSGVVSCWPYVLLPLAAIWIWRRTTGGRLNEVLGQGAKPCIRIFSSVARWLWATIYAAIALISLVLPVVVLLKTAGPASTYATAWKTAHSQISTSVLHAAASATVMAALALSLALGIHRSRGLWRASQEFASLLSIALPGTLFGMAAIFLWNRPQTQFIYGTGAVVLLLYLARFLPFAIHPQVAGLEQIGSNLLDAARLADRPSASTACHILLPLLAPTSMVGWALGFVLSLHELAGTLLVVPPGMETLSVRIYSLYHYGAGQLVAALALFLVVLSVLILGMTTVLCQWIAKR